MTYKNTITKYLAMLITCLLLVGCSGDEVTGTGVQGTSANKEPLKNNDVVLRDKTGNTATTKTNEQGEFTLDVTGLVPPYLIRTETESGTLYSIASSEGVTNISPLTDIVVRNWFNVKGMDIDNVFISNDEALALPTASDIDKLVTAINNLISTVYTSFGLGTDYDFIHEASRDGFIDMLANTTIIFSGNELSIIIETPPPSPVLVSILVAFNFSDDLGDDSTIAPSQPDGLSTTVSMEAVQLLWNVSRDNVGTSYYNIYRSDQIGGDYEFLADSVVAHYSDTSLASGARYCYQVEAVDASGQVSLVSAPNCATTGSLPNCSTNAGYSPLAIGESAELSDYWSTQVDSSDTSAIYTWSLDSKPDESLFVLGPLDVQTATYSFTPDVIGNYRINFEISADSLGCDGAGSIWDIQVFEPVVAVTLVGLASSPLSTVIFDGSGSTGPASQGIIRSKWSIASGPAGYFPLIVTTSLNGARYTPTIPGNYEVLHEASNDISTSTELVMFTSPVAGNTSLLPIANGGEDQTISLGETVTLDSSGSYDPNDALATITSNWSMYAAPPGSLDPGVITTVSGTLAEFTPQSSGDYIMELVVNNSVNNSYRYYSTITVTP